MSLVALSTRVVRRTLDALLLAVIATVLGTLLIARILPAVTGGQTFVLGGGSMEPAIPLGSAVLAVPVRAADLRVGDVVTMRVGPQHAVFTHRVIRLVSRDGALWLATRGDGNLDPDPSLVPASDVIGRVDRWVPLAGYAIALLGTVSGVAFLVSLAGLLLAGAWLLEAVEDDRAAAHRLRAPA